MRRQWLAAAEVAGFGKDFRTIFGISPQNRALIFSGFLRMRDGARARNARRRPRVLNPVRGRTERSSIIKGTDEDVSKTSRGTYILGLYPGAFGQEVPQ